MATAMDMVTDTAEERSKPLLTSIASPQTLFHTNCIFKVSAYKQPKPFLFSLMRLLKNLQCLWIFSRALQKILQALQIFVHAQDRLQLGNKRKAGGLSPKFRSPCKLWLTHKIGGGSGIKEKPVAFLCIPLALHYLCTRISGQQKCACKNQHLTKILWPAYYTSKQAQRFAPLP